MVAEEENRQRTGAGVGANDWADIRHQNARNAGDFRLDDVRQRVRLILAIAMADENHLPFRVDDMLLDAVGKDTDAAAATRHLLHNCQMTFLINVHNRLDTHKRTDNRAGCRQAAAAIEEHQVIDGEPVNQVLNMLLDPLLIFVFDMGIAGASIATAISQLTSFVILLVMCSTHADAITIHPRNYRPTRQMYAKILNNGLPSLGRQGIMSVSTSLLNNAAAVYGDPAIAAFAIVSRCLNFVNSTVVGFGQGFQPVCGFNYGARKYDRMHRAFSFSVKVTTIVLLVLGAAGFAFAEPVVTLFRRSDPEVIRIGTETFRIQILTVWAWGFITLSNMYTQAIGYGIRSTILAAARQGLFLIPTLLVLPNVWGLRGLEVCQPLADVLTLALAVWMMTKVIRTQKAQMAQETA